MKAHVPAPFSDRRSPGTYRMRRHAPTRQRVNSPAFHERFDFLRCTILAASQAAVNMVVHLGG